MSWVALTLEVEGAHADILSDALLALGALSVDIRDARAGTAHERPLFDEPGAADGGPGGDMWALAALTALLPSGTDPLSVVPAAARMAGLANMPAFRTAQVEEQDWVRTTQSQFEPIRISPRLWIVPTWHRPPDPTAINLALDPGIAFGTGSHPTTRLCLTWLDENLQRGEDVLDYGCGSGILAIAAWKLGARHVRGVDIDGQAVAASRRNAALNGCDMAWVTFHETRTEIPSLANGMVDVVVANILANPLIMLAPVLAQAIRQGGSIVLSGILEPQAEEVVNAYRPWVRMQPAGTREGWILLAGVKIY